jgi:hypothetical protein
MEFGYFAMPSHPPERGLRRTEVARRLRHLVPPRQAAMAAE